MHTRRSKNVESTEIVHLSFVEVKVEPDDYSELMQTEDDMRSSEVNKPTTTLPPKKTKTKENRTYKKWTRSTQVTEEDIDMLKVRRPYNHDENKSIKPNGTESTIPQCRFCLRRVSRENLKIIVRDLSVKALAAFQIRVFPNDAYPFACSNCLNVIDIILDYKSTVIKARNLLLDKRMHVESNGWDDPVNIQSFNQCKLAVEQHRMQINAIYDDHITEEERSNTHTLEPKMELIIGKEDVTRDEINQIQSTATLGKESTVEFLLEAGFENMENVLKSNIADGSVDSEQAKNTDEIFELSSEKTAHEHNNDLLINGEGMEPVKKRKAREQKVDFSSESAQNKGDDDLNSVDSSDSNDDDHDYIPELVKSGYEQEIVSELSSSKKDRTPQKDGIEPRQSRAKIKRKKGPRNPRKPRKSQKVQPVLCDLCGESVYPETIEGHRNRHLGIKPYKCPVDGCDWSFYGRSNMCTHIRRVHQNQNDRVHKCDICGKLIRGQPGLLNTHKKRHSNEKNHVCQICGKGFTMKWYLTQHSIVHTGDFPHKCQYCGKRFNNKWSMKTHEKNIHEKKNQVSIESQVEEYQH